MLQTQTFVLHQMSRVWIWHKYAVFTMRSLYLKQILTITVIGRNISRCGTALPNTIYHMFIAYVCWSLSHTSTCILQWHLYDIIFTDEYSQSSSHRSRVGLLDKHFLQQCNVATRNSSLLLTDSWSCFVTDNIFPCELYSPSSGSVKNLIPNINSRCRWPQCNQNLVKFCGWHPKEHLTSDGYRTSIG